MGEVERLIEELANADKEARVYAAKLLGELNDVRAVPALVGALKDEDSEVRWRAAGALGNIAKANPGDAEVLKAVPALLGTLKDEDSGVRRWTAEALGEIAIEDPGNSEVLKAVPALIGALKDDEWGVRDGAARALERVAQANRDAVGAIVPVLIGALKDDDWGVRSSATAALGRIIGGCDKTESLDVFEEKLMEGAASLMKGSRSRDNVHYAMMKVAGLTNKVAARKNELARMEMEAGGLILAGERPKPPRDGGMYRAGAKQSCIR